MQQPRMIDGDSARLVGRVHGREVVRIQRYAIATDRWVDVGRRRADTSGRYRIKVRAIARPRYFRAVSGTASSRTRTVVGTAPDLEPDTSGDPATPTEPDAPGEPETPGEPDQPAEPPTPDVPTDDCGSRPARTDGSLWSCTLNEDFSGDTLDRSLWQPATGFLGGSEPARPCYVDDPSVISVRDGALLLGARHVETPVTCSKRSGPTSYVAGGVNTYRRFSQQYGRFEARFKSTATRAPGLQESFWLWPDDRYNTALWPAAGEIDIAETYSEHPDLAIPFLHYTWNDNWGPVPGLNTAWNCAAERGVYNTYTLEWTATRLRILVNGRTCLVNTSGDPAFHKPYIVALTQLMGTATNMYDGRAPLPAEMAVDYVRVWE